jgi:DNA-binding transcriptional LysR family regulator
MARTDVFTGLVEFIAVSKRSSFRAAGADLGVSPSAISQAIRALEARVGMPLFQRTTRTVALTEVGANLLAQLTPAAQNIREALDGISALRAKPAGYLRLSVPRIALSLVLWRVLPDFRKAFPDIEVELDINDASIDVIGHQYDAGIRIGEFIEQDMIAVRLTEPFRWVVVGSKVYFDALGRPSKPTDLVHHDCIRYRFPTARTIYRWEFVTRGRSYSLEPRGGITVNDHLAMIDLAIRGQGLAYTTASVAEPYLATTALEEVLTQHLPTKPGLFLYFPSRNETQPKLRAFIDFTTKILRTKPASRLNTEK